MSLIPASLASFRREVHFLIIGVDDALYVGAAGVEIYEKSQFIFAVSQITVELVHHPARHLLQGLYFHNDLVINDEIRLLRGNDLSRSRRMYLDCFLLRVFYAAQGKLFGKGPLI
jgi:hypothetical protein